MYLDSQLLFSDSQTIIVSTVGTNVIDLSQDRSIGNGEPMAVIFNIVAAADQTTGDEDYMFDVEYASDAGLSSDRQLMGRRIFQSGTPISSAQNADLLVPGFSIVIPLPPTTLAESERFIGVRYDVSGTTPSVTVTTALIPLSMVDAYNTYANGYTIT